MGGAAFDLHLCSVVVARLATIAWCVMACVAAAGCYNSLSTQARYPPQIMFRTAASHVIVTTEGVPIYHIKNCHFQEEKTSFLANPIIGGNTIVKMIKSGHQALSWGHNDPFVRRIHPCHQFLPTM